MEKAVFCWSGGKDSALALYEVLGAGEYDVRFLLTTVNREYCRIMMHGVRQELLVAQSQSIGIPLKQVLLRQWPTNEEYDEQMASALSELSKEGISTAVFGDIYLEDLRVYREKRLCEVGFKGQFPLWKKDPSTLASKLIELGFKAKVAVVDLKVLDESFAGREFNQSFLDDLPEGVDPCGENGEFHTFVYAGPIFKEAISVKTGEKVVRDERFCFCDILKA